MAAWPTTTPPAWLTSWAIWRFKNRPDPKPVFPAPIPEWAWEFLKWCEWKRKGGVPPRPAGTGPTKIPAWAWDVLKLVNQAVPVKDIKPPTIVQNVHVGAVSGGRPDAARVMWDASIDNVKMASYKIYRTPNTLQTPTHVGSSPASSLFFEDYGLAPGRYYYRVSAVDTSGNETDPSKWASFEYKLPTTWTLPFPFIFTAWGFHNQTFTADWLARKCILAGIKTVGIQIGQGATQQDVAILKSFGLKVVLWGIASLNDQDEINRLHPDGYMPQIEGPYQYLNCKAALDAGIGAGLPRTIVTTYSGASLPEEVNYLKSKGIDSALVETYAPEGDPYGNVPYMIHTGHNFGWQTLWPTIGLYHGKKVSDHNLTGWGRNFGIWLAELMTEQDWVDVAQVSA